MEKVQKGGGGVSSEYFELKLGLAITLSYLKISKTELWFLGARDKMIQEVFDHSPT